MQSTTLATPVDQFTISIAGTDARHGGGSMERPGYGTAIGRTYAKEAGAGLARAVLEGNGIAAVVMGDSAGGMLPSMALISEVRLEVRAEDVEDAREILEAGDG